MKTVIFANEYIEVALEHSDAPDDPDLVIVRDPHRAYDMPGEVLVAPVDIPDLVKALTTAAARAKQG